MSVRRRGSGRGPAGFDGGFTLVEMLVTIVVLGILAGVAIPTMHQVRQRVQDGAAQAGLREALGASRQYHAENEQYTISQPVMRAHQPSLDWRASSGVNVSMTTAADVGRIHFERDGPDVLVLGTRSGSTRCFYLYSRLVGGVEQLSYASPSDPADCRDPWDYRFSINAGW